VTSSGDPDAGSFGDQQYTIIVPEISTASPLPSGVAGTNYQQQFAWTGPAGGSWSVQGGALPPGLTLSAAGLLQGPLNQAGTFNFTINVTANGISATKVFAMQVTPAPLTITTNSLQPGVIGQNYSQTVQATGGTPPYVFSGTGLPPGLSISLSGVITGMPTVAAVYNVTISVTDSAPAVFNKLLPLTINSPLTFTTLSLQNGITNTAYNQQVSVTGGISPYSYSATGLPAGLSITPGSGLITGAPTEAGTFSVTVMVRDSANNQVSKQFSLFVINALTILTTSLPDGTVGLNYFQQVLISGGEPVYLVSATGLPDGLGISSAGKISGTPTKAGVFTVTISVRDSLTNTTSKDLSLTISAQPSFVTSSPLPPATAGTVYSVTFAGTGGLSPYNYFLQSAASSLPPGLALSQAGVLSGTPPAAGVFTFTVQLVDQNKSTISQTFQLTVSTGSQSLILSTTSIQFSISPGGVSGPQQVTVTPSGDAQVSFTTKVDDGNGGAAPPWLVVVPTSGSTPGVIRASLVATPLQTGTYNARIRVVSPGAPPSDIAVTLNVSNPPAQLTLSPNIVRAYGRVNTPSVFDQTFLIQNAGGGNPVPVTLTVANGSSWITSVTPSAPMIRAANPIRVKISFNTQGLRAGSYRDAIHVTTPLSAPYDKFDIPVVLAVADSGPIMAIFKNGVRIQARQGNPTSRLQQINVLNLGDPGTSVNWKAQAIRGAELVNISNPSGVSTPGNPSSFGVRLTPAATSAVGGASALIQVTDSQSQFSPQYVIVVADVTAASAPTSPDPEPAGVVFVASAGGAAPAAQQVTVNTASTDPVALSISTATDDGSNWLSAQASSATTSLANPAQVTISVSPGSLTQGFYSGQVNLAFGSVVRGVFVTLVLKSNGSVAALPAETRRDAGGCTPSAITIGQTGLPNNFTAPVSWPTSISVVLSDDCGNMLSGASVSASFSNGDDPIALAGDFQSGSYSATWAPAHATTGMTVTLDASSSGLMPAEMQIGGNVDPNATPSPSLAIAGLLNNLNPVPGAGLAPGTVTQVYGDNLTDAPDSPSNVPLPTEYKGVIALVGGIPAPIYYISKTQLTVQVPVELAPNLPYQALLVSGTGFSLPQPVNLVPVAPGTVTFTDGRIVAQHTTDYSYVDSSHPAKSGETVAVYLVGMGATNPSVPSGVASPSNPLAKVPSVVVVLIDGQPANVSFAGLTPGGVGLYQINFVVPAGLKSGTLDIAITQGGIKANAATLVVGN
jgi:uncharacterized protein (TIGR03437 family)